MMIPDWSVYLVAAIAIWLALALALAMLLPVSVYNKSTTVRAVVDYIMRVLE